MCGRFASFLPAEAKARIFGTTNPLPNLAPSWNVAPTNDVAVVPLYKAAEVVGSAVIGCVSFVICTDCAAASDAALWTRAIE